MHAKSPQPAQAEPRKVPRTADPPSEVPTEPGNDARAGAARAAALRALALPDDEVTAQRDISALRALKDFAADDLDEDTSVIQGFKMPKKGASEAPPPRAAERPPREERAPKAPNPDLMRTVADHDDRPTPTDDLSSTSPPDTSRTSTAKVEAAMLDGGETARYAPGDTPWVATAHRGRTPTIHNPAMAAEAAAADAAVAASPVSASHPNPPAQPGASPVFAFRVAVIPSRSGGPPRVVALAPGAAPPAGASTAMLVATGETESAAIARLFGIAG
jgi:hypothetical protein